VPRLTEELAWAIVNEAKASDLNLGPEPATIDQAAWLLRHAKEDWDNGVRGDLVRKFLSMGGLLEDGMDGPSTRGDAVTQETTGELGEPDPTPHRAVTDALVANHRLPIPKEFEGEPPQMPRDLTEIDDRRVRRLHAEFNAWLNRTLYLIGVERADQQSADLLFDQAKRRVLMAADKIDHVTGKPKLATVLNAEVESSPEVQKWHDRVIQHKANLHVLYSLKDVYAGNVERLWKEWRMRRDSYDMAGGS